MDYVAERGLKVKSGFVLRPESQKRQTEFGVMVKTSPTSVFKVPKTKFLLGSRRLPLQGAATEAFAGHDREQGGQPSAPRRYVLLATAN